MKRHTSTEKERGDSPVKDSDKDSESVYTEKDYKRETLRVIEKREKERE